MPSLGSQPSSAVALRCPPMTGLSSSTGVYKGFSRTPLTTANVKTIGISPTLNGPRHRQDGRVSPRHEFLEQYALWLRQDHGLAEKSLITSQ